MVVLFIFYFEGLSACVVLTSQFLYLFPSPFLSGVTLSFKAKIEEPIQEIISSAAAILDQNCKIILFSLISSYFIHGNGNNELIGKWLISIIFKM